jgi:hypothetical protein
VPRRYPTPSRVKIEVAVRAPTAVTPPRRSSTSATTWQVLYGSPIATAASRDRSRLPGMGRRSDLLGVERGFLGDAQAARSADPSPLQPTRFGGPDVRASRQERGEEAGGSLPRYLSNADARLTLTTGGRSRRHRRSAGNSSRCSCTWRRSHRNRLLYRCCPGPPSKSGSFRSCSIGCWSCRASRPPAARTVCIACIASVSSRRPRSTTRPVRRPRGSMRRRPVPTVGCCVACRARRLAA